MLETLHDLMKEQVRDLYSAESQLLKALPKMAKASTNELLRTAFESHLEETRVHLERLQQIAELLEVKPGGKKCKAMEGLIAEGAEVLDEDGAGEVIDAALIAAAQRVEHYEISAYGSARAVAERLNLEEIVGLLDTTLEEESAADEKLTTISLEEVLPGAPSGEEEEAQEVQVVSSRKKQTKSTKTRR
jgi:ferritin-like metal-binding protein YciE